MDPPHSLPSPISSAGLQRVDKTAGFTPPRGRHPKCCCLVGWKEPAEQVSIGTFSQQTSGTEPGPPRAEHRVGTTRAPLTGRWEAAPSCTHAVRMMC